MLSAPTFCISSSPARHCRQVENRVTSRSTAHDDELNELAQSGPARNNDSVSMVSGAVDLHVAGAEIGYVQHEVSTST